MQKYEKVIEDKNKTFNMMALVATMVGGGVFLTTTRTGALLLTFPKEAGKAFISPLSKAHPPAAGILKGMIAKEFGPRTAEIFARATIPAAFLGAPALSVPGGAGHIKDGISFVLNPARETADPLVTGQNGEKAGACQDQFIAEVESIRKRIEIADDFNRREAECNALSGARAAACRESLERHRSAVRRQPSQDRINAILGREPPAHVEDPADVAR